MKKGDLSINIIIVAAIALIILVIISVLLFGTGMNIRDSTSCEGISGVCRDSPCADYNGDPEGSVWLPHPSAECRNDGERCCIRQ